MKKKLFGLFTTAALMLSLSLNAFASVNSVEKANLKLAQLDSITSYNFIGLVNKNELIGEYLNNFNLKTEQYKNEVSLARENVRNIINQIEYVNKEEITDEEKNFKLNKLYKDIDAILFQTDSLTVQYIYSLQMFMPSLTYQRYAKDFRAVYKLFS